MGKGTVLGYAILFIFLFMLIGVHPGFFFLFFLAIIITIIYNIRKRKKSKVSVNEIHTQDWSKKDNRNISEVKKTLPIDTKKEYDGLTPVRDQSNLKNYDEKRPEVSPPQTRKQIVEDAYKKAYREVIEEKSTSEEQNKKTIKKGLNKYVGTGQTRDFETSELKTVDLNEAIEAINEREAKIKFQKRYPNLDNFHLIKIGNTDDSKVKEAITKTKTSKEFKSSNNLDDYSQSTSSLRTPSKNLNKPQKPSFNRNYWDIGKYQITSYKRQKFLEVIEFCKANNLGSKSKIRRLGMKMDKWNIENERDIEAFLPDYEYLVNLIKEFQNN